MRVWIQEAEGLYKTMVKRFRQNKAVWLSYGTFLLQQGQNDAASALLQRALKSLPPKESKNTPVSLFVCFYDQMHKNSKKKQPQYFNG